MSLLWRLLLGHTIGDFVLQTIDLVRYKAHSWKGLLLHATLVLISTAVFLYDLPWAWPWLIPLFLTHVLTDWGKVTLSRLFPKRRLSFFLLDQIVHLAIIVLVVWLAEPAFPYADLAAAVGGSSPEATLNLLFLLALLIAVAVVPLLEVQISWKMMQVLWNSDPLENGQAASLSSRFWGGGERSLVLAFLYVWITTGWPVIWMAPLAFVPRVLAAWQDWKETPQARWRAVHIATSITSTALLCVVLWFLVGPP